MTTRYTAPSLNVKPSTVVLAQEPPSLLLASHFATRKPSRAKQLRGGQSCDAAANDHIGLWLRLFFTTDPGSGFLRVSLLCDSLPHCPTRVDGGVESFSERHIQRVPGKSCAHLARHVGVADANSWIGKAKRAAGSGRAERTGAAEARQGPVS